jgi:carbamoyl-phosphate synthase small subunit
MKGANLIPDVTIAQPVTVAARGERRFSVAAIDLGVKDNSPASMAERGMEVRVLPADTSFAQLRDLRPDGVFFSNGPGDPDTADAQVALLKEVLDAHIPFFGICLGNQLFGRALGFGTYKLKYGHRGINLPVMDLTTNKVEITAQNHGFAVDAPLHTGTQTPWGIARVSHICLNDQVVEGLELRDPAGKLAGFSVQYHPEASAGPHEAAYLFDRFAMMMGGAA